MRQAGRGRASRALSEPAAAASAHAGQRGRNRRCSPWPARLRQAWLSPVTLKCTTFHKAAFEPPARGEIMRRRVARFHRGLKERRRGHFLTWKKRTLKLTYVQYGVLAFHESKSRRSNRSHVRYWTNSSDSAHLGYIGAAKHCHDGRAPDWQNHGDQKAQG